MTDLTTPTKVTTENADLAQGDAPNENSKSLIQDLTSPLSFIYKKLSAVKENEENSANKNNSKTEEQRANRALRAMRREQEKRERLAQDKLSAGNFNRRKSYQPTQTVPKPEKQENDESLVVTAKIPKKIQPKKTTSSQNLSLSNQKTNQNLLPAKKTSSISIKSDIIVKHADLIYSCILSISLAKNEYRKHFNKNISPTWKYFQ